MTPKDIAEARKIIDAATSGPWKAITQGEIRLYDSKGIPLIDANDSYLPLDDATFIAAARTGWPQALDEIERLALVNRGLLNSHEHNCKTITDLRKALDGARLLLNEITPEGVGKQRNRFAFKNAVLEEKLEASAVREKVLIEERDQLLEALELKDKLIAHQREQHAAREKILVEALIHIACLKRLDRYNCTLETTREFARDVLVKLQSNE